jgi:hypothetical protein
VSALRLAPTPAEVIDQARLAIDPIKAMQAFRVIEAFRKWSDARPGRMMRSTSVKLSRSDLVGMADVSLYQDGLLVAECTSSDWFDALAHALQIAEAA